jgi:hypothetical protein
MRIFGQRRWRLVAVAVVLVVVAASVAVGLTAGGGSSTPVHGQTYVADATTYLNTSQPDRNYGTTGTIRLSAKPRMTGFVRFNVKGISGPVSHAWLRLWVQSAPVGSLSVNPMPQVGWNESSLTFDNSPPWSPAPIAQAKVQGGHWSTIDVTSAVQANGETAFALVAASGARVSFDSRHGARPPELVVQSRSSGLVSQSSAYPSALLNGLQDTVHATAAHSGLHDDKGNSMDSLKVIQDSYGGYIGIYHTSVGGVYRTMVATSSDLMTWHSRTVVDEHASQPTIEVMPDTSYLVVEEADSNGLTKPAKTWLRFVLFPTRAALLADQPSRTFDAPHTLVGNVGGAEGTPSVDWVAMHPDLAHSVIRVGFHYFMNASIDREAVGTLVNFSSWMAQPDQALNNALTKAGLVGDFGERDSFVYGNTVYEMVEAQAVPGGRWDAYLYSPATGQVRPLQVKTPAGSSEFANPHVTMVRGPTGASDLLTTLFLPQRGAKGNEAGELIYYAPTASGPRSGDPVIVAAGDISCDPTLQVEPAACQQAQTAALVEQIAPDALLPLGDDQYDQGRYGTFLNGYDATWGLLREISHPVPGNHEYESKGAAGYYQYYGVAAGPAGQGYYSYDIGSWHLIALNANCSFVGGCGAGSAEERWLAADLASNTQKCILAYWHQPRFSSGEHGDEAIYDAFWRDLYTAHAAIILNGHDHDYERFATQTPDEQPSPQGIREFVVGTGGKSLRGFNAIQPTSQVRNSSTFGVLQLTLHSNGYDWKFVPIAGQSFTDSGSGTCP